MTILEKLREEHPDAEGINDARNIAEAVACINNNGNRGANAIADQFPTVQSTEELVEEPTEPAEPDEPVVP